MLLHVLWPRMPRGPVQVFWRLEVSSGYACVSGTCVAGIGSESAGSKRSECAPNELELDSAELPTCGSAVAPGLCGSAKTVSQTSSSCESITGISCTTTSARNVKQSSHLPQDLFSMSTIVAHGSKSTCFQKPQVGGACSSGAISKYNAARKTATSTRQS